MIKTKSLEYLRIKLFLFLNGFYLREAKNRCFLAVIAYNLLYKYQRRNQIVA